MSVKPRGQRPRDDLGQLVEHHEQIDWSDVPTIEVVEASAWVARLIKAHEHMEGDR